MKKLNSPEDWKGIWTALITPFNNDGTIDHKSLQVLMESQIKDGITGLVIAGSTGEGSLLSLADYAELIAGAVKISANRIPIVAGVGIGGTADCMERAAVAKKSEASGLLASPPAYIKAPARGLTSHYKKLCTLGLPLCIYDVPSRSASGVPDEVVNALLNDSAIAPQIHALKDATGKPERIENKTEWKKKIAVLSGDDESFPQFVHKGGHGIISVGSHFALKDFISVLQMTTGADERFKDILPFLAGIYWESNPIPTKSLAHKLGWIATSKFREPLCPMKSELLGDLFELHRKYFT
jgi:4-hydroxy-tetrahydrodipicolinate synthase